LTRTPLRVCGASHLLPGAAAWAPLETLWALNFGDFADWPSALMTAPADALLWILTLDDVLTPESLEGLDEVALEDALARLTAPLEARLAASTQPTVVAWTAWRPQSPIASARRPPAGLRAARRLETLLYGLAAQRPALHLVDLDAALAGEGLAAAFDTRNLYAAGCRFSRKGLVRVVEAVEPVLQRVSRPPKKVLVLDCDGVLWGDVVGEVGVGRILLGGDGLGRAHRDIQRAARRLGRAGTLLALASKNTAADVWEVFDRHPDMVLTRDDIAAWRIDWTEKAVNLVEMAKDLDLGLESFVFLDDNPFEREKMRLALPQVTTLEFPADVTAWPGLIDALDLFARFDATLEDAAKTQQYRSRAAFADARRGAADETSFLAGLEMQAVSAPLDPTTLARAEQLAAKTNQYNLRNARHTAAELEALAASPTTIAFLTRLKDRFGDHGAVGLTIARVAGETAFLDTFLMSCRVLGRHLDAWMLACCAGRLRDRGVRWLFAEFKDSGRNAVAAQFLTAHGFARWMGPDSDSRFCAVAELSTIEGELYVADLDTLVIPHLDLFHDPEPQPQPEAHRALAAAVS
jgi:FkbH-like protein